MGPWDQQHTVPSGEFPFCSTASRELFLPIFKWRLKGSLCLTATRPSCQCCSTWHKRVIHFSTWPNRWGERACSLTEIKDALIREERGENAITSNTNLHLSSIWRSFHTEWQRLVPFSTEHQINTLTAAPEHQQRSQGTLSALGLCVVSGREEGDIHVYFICADPDFSNNWLMLPRVRTRSFWIIYKSSKQPLNVQNTSTISKTGMIF